MKKTNQIGIAIQCRSLQEEAIHLRKSLGWTQKQIGERLNVSSSTISNWVKDIQLTTKQLHQIKKNSNQKISNHSISYRNNLRTLGKNLAQKYKDNSLFMLGCGLYWGEGSKINNKSMVDLANTDPNMLIIWIQFINKFLNIKSNQIKLRIHLYKNTTMNIDQVQKYWIKTLNLPKHCISEAKIYKYEHKKEIKHPYGVCHIVVYGRKYIETMLGFLEYIKENF